MTATAIPGAPGQPRKHMTDGRFGEHGRRPTGDGTGDPADAMAPRPRHGARMPTAGTVARLRVLIADPQAAVRTAATALLRTEGLDVVADVEPGDAVVDLVMTLRPDVVLIDVSPYASDGLELGRRVAALPGPPAVVLMSTAPADAVGADAAATGACLSKAGLTAATVARAAARAEPAPLRLRPGTTNDRSTIR
jgi:CheY-like chemotaxis protein